MFRFCRWLISKIRPWPIGGGGWGVGYLAHFDPKTTFVSSAALCPITNIPACFPSHEISIPAYANISITIWPLHWGLNPRQNTQRLPYRIVPHPTVRYIYLEGYLFAVYGPIDRKVFRSFHLPKVTPYATTIQYIHRTESTDRQSAWQEMSLNKHTTTGWVTYTAFQKCFESTGIW